MMQKEPISKKAVLYARVSSKEQEREGYSIPAQKKLLVSYAQKHGYDMANEVIAEGFHGKLPKEAMSSNR